MNDITNPLDHLPRHECGMSLEHNPHKSVYQNAADWIAENDWVDWKSEKSKQKSIETDEIWTLQWYPDTPVSFFAVAAPTLAELIRIANNNTEETTV